MDVAKLILGYIQSLAWPAVAVFALLLFRKSLVAILNRFRGAWLPGGVSLDFAQEVRDVQALSVDVANAPSKKQPSSITMLPITEANARMINLGFQPSPSGLDMDRYHELAQQDPNLALAGLRMEVEILTRNLAKKVKLKFSPSDSASVLLGQLLKLDAITPDQYRLAEKIVSLCNAAVHGTPVSREEAEDVIDAARVLARYYLSWLSWGFEDNWTPHVT